MKPTLGFIGLGLMGAPMATRLIEAGYTVRIFNRTQEKCIPLISKGAQSAPSPAGVAEYAEIVFTMLTNDDALRNASVQIQSTLRKGGVHVDCSTVSPALTLSLEHAYAESGRYFLHTPVLGSIPQATDGSLLLFVGGSDAAFQKAESVLAVVGKKVWRFPKAEQASSMKLIMNSFIAGMIATLSQALVYADKSGVDGETVLDVLNSSALNTPMYQTKGRSIQDGNFSPRFFLENLLKDTRLFCDAAQTHAVRTPVAEAVKKLLEEGVARGMGKEDYSAIVKIL